MKRLEILVVGLICGLVLSFALNVILARELMESQELHRDLSRTYDQLRQSYDELKETYSPKPPISKSEAIDIALEYGGCNETSLQGMQVSASLNFVFFRRRGRDFEFGILHEVTAHVSDYRPKETCRDGDCTTFRYVWTVVVQQSGPGLSIPPPGLYYVDAATGEVISYDDIRLSSGFKPPPVEGVPANEIETGD